MSLLRVVELIARVMLYILEIEQTFPPSTGTEKESALISKLTPALEAPGSPAFTDLASLEELVSAVTALIRALVALLNLLGVFRRSPPAKPPAPAA